MFPFEDASRIIANGLLQNVAELCIIARDYRIVWASGTYLASRNIEADGCQGKTCYKLFRSKDGPCPDCPIRTVLDSGRPCVMEKKIDLSDGSRWEGEVDVFPVYDSGPRPSFVLKMGRDSGPGPSDRDAARRLAPPVRSGTLTAREMDVLRLVAEGRTNPEIASLLAISRHTVKTHVTSVFNKLGTANRAEAILMATRLQIIQ